MTIFKGKAKVCLPCRDFLEYVKNIVKETIV